MPLYSVAANTPFNQSILTYESEAVFERGDHVVVPLSTRKVDGCVLSLSSENNLKNIKNIVSTEPARKIPLEILNLSEWMAKFYRYPLGMVLFDIVPKIMKRPRKVEFYSGPATSLLPSLNDEQEEIFSQLFDSNKGELKKESALIHGVTGSGKSMIYFHCIQEITKRNQSVLYLLPEINLTPQFLKDLNSFFAVDVLPFHSELTASEKSFVWNEALKDEPKIFIGVRSSVFLPIENLGLIIVDEEHDSSFKQDDRCQYNARDVALFRGRKLEIPVLLGSATPSVEIYQAFDQKQKRFCLKKRHSKYQLPEVIFADMKDKIDPEVYPFHPKSLDLIDEALERNEQVLLFLNRLGYSNFLQCRACSAEFNCPNCSVKLRYSKKRNQLSCQICSYVDMAPDSCPECSNTVFSFRSFGTEKIEETFKLLYPDIRYSRFDRDSVSNFSQLKTVLEDFHSGRSRVLIGTQMMAKGHNFENVNTVIVLGIDSGLNYPDYRSHERVYQLLTQIVGRAGRYSQHGKVCVQTHHPDNPLFLRVRDNDFDGFYEEEIGLRHSLELPPFSFHVPIYFSSPKQQELMQFANSFVSLSKRIAADHFPLVNIVGPRPAIIEKRVNKFTWSVLVSSRNLNEIHNLLATVETYLKLPSKLTMKADLHPYQIM